MPPKRSQTRASTATRSSAKKGKVLKSKETIDSDDDQSTTESTDHEQPTPSRVSTTRKRVMSDDDLDIKPFTSTKKPKTTKPTSTSKNVVARKPKSVDEFKSERKPVVSMRKVVKRFVDNEASESDRNGDNTEEETEEEEQPRGRQRRVNQTKTSKKQLDVSTDDSDIEVIETPTKPKSKSSMTKQSSVKRARGAPSRSASPDKWEEVSNRKKSKVTHEPSPISREGLASRSASPISWKESSDEKDQVKKRKTKAIDNKTVKGKNTEKAKEAVVLYEDLRDRQPPMHLGAMTPPNKCEVTQPALWDPLLKKTYNNLPPLWDGAFESTAAGSEEDSGGPFSLTDLPKLFRDIKISYIKDIITFEFKGRYYNPSRIAPHMLKTAAVSESKTSAVYAILGNATANNHYAIFTSVVVVSQSDLSLSTSSLNRSISGILCKQEWQRLCAFFCMLFKSKVLGTYIKDDALAFTTRQKLPNTAGTSSNLSLIRASGSGSSPVKYNNFTSTKGALGFLDTVPIYDGTKQDIDMDRLDQLSRLLPLFHGDPNGSVCLVGYTANTWTSKTLPSLRLSCNVQWIVVLAY